MSLGTRQKCGQDKGDTIPYFCLGKKPLSADNFKKYTEMNNIL